MIDEASHFSCPVSTRPIGRPPGGWSWATLESIARLESGHTPSRKVAAYWEGGDVPWLSLKDIRGISGKYVTDTIDRPTKWGIDNSSARLLPKGTVALCRTASVGKVVILGREMATSQDFVNWVCGSTLLPEYLYWAIRSSNDTFSIEKQGSTHQTIYMPVLKRFQLLLPPLAEQRRIAEVLDRAEALRAKRRAALAQLDELTQAIFLDMFGDPVSNPKGFPKVRFENVCDRVTVGIVVRPSSYYVEDGVPALRSLNVKPGKIVLNDVVYFSKSDNETHLKKTRLFAGDLVLVRTGQPGTAAVVPPELDGINAIDLLISTPRSSMVSAKFLCEFFNSAGGRDLVLSSQRGQVQKHLNVGSLAEAMIPLPPIEVQHEFARRVTAVETLKTAHRASLAELDALFASLQHRAFRGEL